jgi:hypothetical protein
MPQHRTSKAKETGVPRVTPGVRIFKERGRGVSGETYVKGAPNVEKSDKTRIKPERNNPIEEVLYYRANGGLTLFIQNY